MNAVNAKSRRPKTARSLAPFLRRLESIVDATLGADDAARRIRTYVADHDAPSDDRSAFDRLCVVVFAQGLGFETVLAKHAELRQAFDDFDPAAVARFDEARIAALCSAPIIRNEAKIRACVENAKRWVSLAEGCGTYLARIADLAAKDDAADGWPALTSALSADFMRIGESAARQTLKRWGFFTAFAHPGARRVLERLAFVDPQADGSAVQRLLGAAAQRLGRDPYSVEAMLALFAGVGPCRKSPRCRECGVADDCPSAAVS